MTSATTNSSHHSVSQVTTQTDPLMNTEIEFITEHKETTSATPDRLTLISTSGSSTNAQNHETATELETATIETSLEFTQNVDVDDIFFETTTRFENDSITDVLTTEVTFGELSVPITMTDHLLISSDFTTNMPVFETTIEAVGGIDSVSTDSPTSDEKGEW